MKSVYELQAEEVEVLGKITELEKSALSEVDIRELKRARKRSFELQDNLTVARNRERQAQKEVSLQHIREAESKNQESYAEMIDLASKCLPKLKKVDALLKQLAVSQNKVVFSGRDANDEARQIQVQFGETITVDVKPLILITRIDPGAVESSIKKLELLLKENDKAKESKSCE